MLIGNGFDDEEVRATLDALEQNGVFVHIVSDRLGTVTGAGGMGLEVDETFTTAHPVLFDSYYIVGGNSEHQTLFDHNVTKFFRQAYHYFKPIGVAKTGQSYAQLSDDGNPAGVVMATDDSGFSENFVAAIAQQRFWDRT